MAITNRVALVTGATGIIGPTICDVLTREGWRVAACASDHDSYAYHEKITGAPLHAAGRFVARFTGRESCHHLVRQIQEQLGPVGLLVNNATTNAARSLAEIDEPHARQMVEVDLLAPLWLSQACETDLVAQRGAIVNISSVQVKKLFPGVILYPVLKAALEELGAALALHLGPRGVRVNSIRVGSVPGPAFMRDTLEKLEPEQARRLVQEVLPRHVEAMSFLSTTGRAGTPEDVAEAVAFLASDRAGFINGAVLPVDGGLAIRYDGVPKPEGWDSKQAVKEWLEREASR